MSPNTETKTDYDAIVIGGGPSGSSYAITMSQAGHSVLVLERDSFPRFHIGESFLPYTADMLELLGVLDKMPGHGFPIKKGLDLILPDGNRLVDLDVTGDEGYRTWTYQVERALFDKILLDAAAESPGVTVLQETPVKELMFDGDRIVGVRFERDGLMDSATAKYVIDASGRAGVITRQLGLRKTDNQLKMAAVFKHFEGLDERYNPTREGDTQIGVHADGWMWAIPIRDDIISVGAMAPVDRLQASTPEKIFALGLERLPRIAQRLTGTRVWHDIRGERNFEYHSDTLAGPGYFVVGDSGCFTDPIFSAGVYLALATGREAAKETHKCLAGETSEVEAQRHYETFFKTGYETYYRLIRAVYDTRVGTMGTYIRKLLTAEGLGEKDRVLTLNGDFWTDSNRFVLRLREHQEYALFSPFELNIGCPVYGKDGPPLRVPTA
ncbi:NAD(P)/FAD-dependent oxidoreductase [Nocardia pneumoniae]|uniref:NAD(P)/FAD-dependent oxidoreductase n=1 Tax=Nocardia pneumoniae TaxID=228601 RepID=UPI0002DA291D|nr:NAD(P)/FAD-dependent oxidoreductase [Nocardia pneumoniae]